MNDVAVEPNAASGGLPTRLEMSVVKPVAYCVEHTSLPVFDPADPTLALALGGDPAVIVVDALLWPAYGAAIEAYARANLACLAIVPLAGGEATKSLAVVELLCDAAFAVNLPRRGAFVAVGGGTILDVVGFAASIYRRGIAYVRVPTTLIGIIDAGVGIKQAINFRDKKNALGSFYPPKHTINDERFLHGLPRRELAHGIAEAIKIGLICDAVLFELLEAHAATLVATGFRGPRNVVTEVLLRSEAAMMQQLSTNLYETDLRRLVDFGHTFSPIIETTSEYSAAHGEAVALDMLLSTAIAAGRGWAPAGLIARLAAMYTRIGLPLIHPAMSPLRLERALADARSHRGGALNLVVPTGIGSAAYVQDVAYDELTAALDVLTALSARR